MESKPRGEDRQFFKCFLTPQYQSLDLFVCLLGFVFLPPITNPNFLMSFLKMHTSRCPRQIRVFSPRMTRDSEKNISSLQKLK